MKYGKISSSVTLESFNNAPKPSLGLFLYGCNFKCGFCHNHTMLGNVNPDQLMTEERLKAVLKRAKSTWKEMIVIGGGEPTLSPELPSLLRHLKHDWGFEIKLDTNGSRPEVLKQLIDEKLVDYIAMDVKGTLDQYDQIAKFTQTEKIKQSMKLVMQLENYEFRTTVLPNLHEDKHFLEIAALLDGAKRFVLQQFRPDLANGCLDETYCKLNKMPKDDLIPFQEILNSTIEEVKIR